MNPGGHQQGQPLGVCVWLSENERSNIDKDEAEALKKLAAQLLSLTAHALGMAQSAGELIEVDCDAKDQISDS